MKDFITEYTKKQLPIDGTHSKLLLDLLKNESVHTQKDAVLLSIAGSLAAIADELEKGSKP